MKAEFHRIFKLFEELEEAGESATLTITSKGGISSIKLLLESSLSLPITGTTTTPLPPVPGRRRRHPGAIPTGNFHFVQASVPQRLALPASNVAVGSVINLDFPILYVLNGNKELIL